MFESGQILKEQAYILGSSLSLSHLWMSQFWKTNEASYLIVIHW